MEELDPLAFRSIITSRVDWRAKELLAIARSCRLGRQVLADPQLWRRLVEHRFTSDVLPPEAQTGACVPQQLEGWVFFQGRTCVRLPPHPGTAQPLEQLLSKAAQVSAEAFTTGGQTFSQVPPVDQWPQGPWSYDPREGLYVAAAAVERCGAHVPDPAPPDPWPPDVPGWTFLPACSLVGVTPIEVPRAADSLVDVLQDALSPSDPLRAVSSRRGSAFRLWPTLPQAFRRGLDWRHGVYVRSAFLASRPGPPPRPLAPPKQLFAELDRLRLPCYECEVAWLDNRHLTLEMDATSSNGAVLYLMSVCWLDVRGTIRGVLPGRYKVVWRTALKHARLPSGDDFWLTLSARVVPRNALTCSHAPTDASAAASGGGGASATANTAAQGTQASPETPSLDVAAGAAQEMCYTAQGLGHLLTAAAPQPPSDWVDVAGPVVEVHSLSDVEVGCFAHDNWWKSSIKWDYVALVAEACGGEQAAGGARSRRSSGEGGCGDRDAGPRQGAGATLFSSNSCVCS